MRRRPLLPLAGFAALALAALLYFWIGQSLTLEWTDEGHLVYRSWRVSQGSLPHRDWQHLYPPTVFLLEGALMRWLGADLAVIRGALSVVKTLVALLVFALARRVAGRTAALLAGALLVAIWGAPLWVFNTSYANHHATVCTLLGLLVVAAGRGSGGRALAAGAAFGLASIFKQTNGLLAFFALLWFLVYERSTGGVAWRLPAVGLAPARWLRLAAVAGPGLFAAFYVLRTPHAWTAVALLTPVLVTAALLVWRERRQPASAEQLAGSLWQALCAAAGLAIAPALLALAFWRAGALAELGRDTLLDLPQQFRWFTPYPTPLAPAALAGASIAMLWVAFAARRRSVRRAAGVAASLAGAAAAARFAGFASRPGVQMWGAWVWGVTGLLALLPPALVWCAMPPVFRPNADAGDRRPLALMLFAAAWSLLLLLPAADAWHVLMVLPIFLVLLAAQLDRLLALAAPSVRSRAAAAAAVALVAAAATPFVHMLFAERAASATPRLARATGIAGAPDSADAAALLAFLAEPARADRPIFVISNQQMFYFLADRPSPFERDEFVFYLVGADLIAPAVAARDVDERQVVDHLRALRPLIIDDRRSPAAARLARVFPALGEALARDYRTAARFGPFEVREWEAPAAPP